MSDQMLKWVVGGVLMLHGLGHGGALAALAWIHFRPGTETGAWSASRAWALPTLTADTAAVIASAFWVVALVGFVVAALSVWGVFVPSGLVAAGRCRGRPRVDRGHRRLLWHLADVQHARRDRCRRGCSGSRVVASMAVTGHPRTVGVSSEHSLSRAADPPGISTGSDATRLGVLGGRPDRRRDRGHGRSRRHEPGEEQGLLPVSDCLAYPYLDVARFIPGDYLWLVPGIMLVPIFVVLMACIHAYAAAPQRIYSRIALSFALVYAVVLAVGDFMQEIRGGGAEPPGRRDRSPDHAPPTPTRTRLLIAWPLGEARRLVH